MTRHPCRKKPQYRLMLSLLIVSALGLVMSACSAPPPAEAQQAGHFLQNPTQTPTAESPPTPIPEAEAPTNYCVSCHQDKEQLITTAAEEQVVEAESSGEG
jgi:hypothetical protein